MGNEEDNSEKADHHNVIIIGGGISGLQAASELTKRGMEDFVLFEGSERLGGRIKTITVGPSNAIVEMGANWVQAVDQNPVFKMAVQNNLMPIDQKARGLDNKVLFAMESGDPVHPRIVSEVDLLFGQLMGECEGFYRDHMPTLFDDDSVGAYIEREFEERITCHHEENKEIRRMVLAQRLLGECIITGAHSMKDISLNEAGCFEDIPGRHSTIPQGFEAIIGLLARDIPACNIHLNSIVTHISWDQTDSDYPIQVTTADDTTHHSKTCLITSSLGYLKKHSTRLFHPPLPDFKMDAIQNLGMGVVDKLVLFFDGPVFPEAISRLEMIWHRDEVLDADIPTHWFKKIPSLESITQDIAMCWLSGKEAEYVESLSDLTIASTLTQVFKGFLSRVVLKAPTVTKVLRSNWKSHPLILGSYCHIPVGTSANAINQLAEPVCNSKNQPVLYFAGEATHPTFYTSSHGAMLSGSREANNILNHLSTTTQPHPPINGVHKSE